jgi:hypothetical protein
VFGHSESRPVLRAVPSWPDANKPPHRSSSDASFGCDASTPHLTMIGGGVVDCAGKAVGSSDAVVVLRGVLISRVDTGGEHRRSAVRHHLLGRTLHPSIHRTPPAHHPLLPFSHSLVTSSTPPKQKCHRHPDRGGALNAV